MSPQLPVSGEQSGGPWDAAPNVGFTGELLKLGKLGLCLEPTAGEMQLNAITSD